MRYYMILYQKKRILYAYLSKSAPCIASKTLTHDTHDQTLTLLQLIRAGEYYPVLPLSNHHARSH